MTVQVLSPALANAIATEISTTFANGFLDFYDSDPATGVLLAEMKLPIAPFNTPSSGAVTMAGQWFGTAIVAGTAAYARFRDITTTYYMTVTVGSPGSGMQLIMSASATFALHDVLSVATFSYTVPTT